VAPPSASPSTTAYADAGAWSAPLIPQCWLSRVGVE
jgi:hypothetical protein